MTRTDATPQTMPVECPKIGVAHRAKLAVVNVRQSTPQQVIENRESLAMQYALADHAISLGWPTERVLVIDEDLGLSGRTADMRLSFQHLLAEVSMDHVGFVLGLEMSRLSRSLWTGITSPKSAPASVPCWPTRTGSTTRPIPTTGFCSGW
jgi:hypothetical protein